MQIGQVCCNTDDVGTHFPPMFEILVICEERFHHLRIIADAILIRQNPFSRVFILSNCELFNQVLFLDSVREIEHCGPTTCSPSKPR